MPTIEQLQAELETITKIELGLGLNAKFEGKIIYPLGETVDEQNEIKQD
ncbi:hypothetical protein [Nostoc sp. ChiSLP03a]|nr:hypothetical protein [Nostoc sp. ChiSLP03a]MDZ8212154.1 hypothetical protein [Nostoc sp. ChiSLP03a]